MDISKDIIRYAFDAEGNYLGQKKGAPDALSEAADSNGWTLSEDAPAAPDPKHRDLSPAEWGIFIDPDVSSFQGVIDAVLTAMPAGVERAKLRSRIERSQFYRLDETLALAGKASVDHPDLNVPTADEIKTAWESVTALDGSA